MRNKYKNIALATIVALAVTSCSKEVIMEETSKQEPNSTLNIRTRIGDEALQENGPKVSYPVNIYIFDTEGQCSEYLQITDESTDISVELLEGTYNVYAIAGADATTYGLPTKEEATTESQIKLIGEKHGDLMTAENMVSLVDGGENTLTLTLQRKVMLIQDVAIKNVPTYVKAVTVTIAPLYESLLINGSYAEEAGSQEITLAEDGDTKVWKNAEGMYLLPPTGASATITINMTDNEDKIKSYSYTCSDELKANYKIKINGTYSERIGVQLSGTISGAEWAGEEEITFDFDENGSEPISPDDITPDDEEDNPVISETAPEVGSFYQDKYYVLKSESANGKTNVTLMTTEEMNSVIKEVVDVSNEQDDVRSAVDAAIAELTADSGIEGWRLPTIEEMDYISKNIDDCRAHFNSANKDFFDFSNFYFMTKQDIISSYSFSNPGNPEHTILAPYTLLRPVTVVTFQ